MASIQWLSFVVPFMIASYVTSQHTSVLTSDDSGVQEIMVPMCKNLVPYNLTKLPNRFGHQTQLRVYRAIEHMWAYMDYGCSANFRLLVCATFLPKYDPETGETTGPCKRVCSRARKGCMRTMRTTRSRWPRRIRCNRYPTTNCIRAFRERRGQAEYSYCTENTMPLCANLPYTHGYLPNFFLQYNKGEIETELQYYNPLINSACNEHLPFFLCGSYIPFCPMHDRLLTPCRELCDQVYSDCYTTYNTLYQRIPWPNKLQCHRYHLSTSNHTCAMPGDI